MLLRHLAARCRLVPAAALAALAEHARCDAPAEDVDVVVIGGGIAGTACALRLAANGRRTVLVERDTIACEATGLSAGTLWCGGAATTPALYDALAYHSMACYEAAEKRQPGCCGLVRCGALSLVSGAPGELAAAEAAAADFRARGVDARLLDREETVALEPALAGGGAVAAIFTPRSGYVDPGDAARAFADHARARGAEVVEGDAAVAVAADGAGGATCACASGRRFRAAQVVVANGSGARPLLRDSFGLEAPVSPVRGQIWVASQSGDETQDLTRVVYSQGSAVAWQNLKTAPAKCTHVDGARRVRHLYGRPRSDCTGVLFGGDRVPVETAAEGYATTDESTASSRGHARELVGPAAVGDGLELDGAWSGPMPFSADGLPLVGDLGALGLPQVWLLDGFGPSGMTLAPAAAEALADAASGVDHPLRAMLREHCDPCRGGGGGVTRVR